MQDVLIDILLVVHVFIAVAMIGVILLQRSEGGGLGIGGGGGGGGGGMAGFMTGRGTANLLTRTTAILAASFMVTSILLSILASNSSAPTSIVDELPLAVPSGATGDSDTPSVPVQ